MTNDDVGYQLHEHAQLPVLKAFPWLNDVCEDRTCYVVILSVVIVFLLFVGKMKRDKKEEEGWWTLY